ncbi:unnamed protein product [Acanthoscelides obtectus]|uniref:Uncharacterized protein n=1 Tax=Acanthoscelides obtectus TaxID=200917 RepID=A0A9P0MA48_ACAOB|nr:unnamed protein product [Acanthoscelides obtectus]CAK1656849.1 hypothetical protein AOBTE_LOCUS19960 [Acanthoscelides obtectus]
MLYQGVPKKNRNYFLKALYFHKVTLSPSKYCPLQLIHLPHRCFRNKKKSQGARSGE